MAKVKDVLGSGPVIKVNPLNVDLINQNDLKVYYDPEADSMVIYLVPTPMRAVSVELKDAIYVKVNPATGDIVGFHVEGWERKFVF